MMTSLSAAWRACFGDGVRHAATTAQLLGTRAKSPARRSMRPAKATSGSRPASRQALVVAGEPAAAGHPGEGTLDHPPAGQQDEPRFAAGGRPPPGRCRARGRPRPGARRCSPGRRRPARRSRRWRPAPPGQLGHGGAVVRVGRRHAQREQVAERVHGQVQLGAARALVAVPAGPRAALGRAAQGAAVQDRGGRLLPAPRRQARHRAQVMRQHLEAAGAQPTQGLVVDRGPRRQVVGHRAPGDAVATK